jgi:hypothetical protein
MKKLSLALAVAAALSTVVVPIAPASAATAVARTASHGALANHAERGNAIILSQTQLNGLARSNPQLHAKLMAAYRTNSIPQLSKGEKRTVQAITQKNMADYKAGHVAAWVWVVIALAIVVLFILLFSPWNRPVARV